MPKITATLWNGSKHAATKYRDRYTITLPDGTRKRVAGYGKTAKEATTNMYAKGKAMLEAAEIDFKRETGTTTFHQLFADYLDHLWIVKKRKQRTIEDYSDVYKRHLKQPIGAKSITTITFNDLESIQKKLMREEKYRTADYTTTLLKSTYKYAMKKYRAQIRAGLSLVNIAADLDKVEVPKPAKNTTAKSWTKDQVAAFLALSQKHYEDSSRHLYFPIWYTLFACGLRYGELAGMRRKAIHTKNGKHYLHVSEQLVHNHGKFRRDTPKTAEGDRLLAITQQHLKLLQKHMQRLDRISLTNPRYNPNDLLFPTYNGNPVENSNLRRAKNSIIQQLDLPEITLHDMRKLAATFVAEAMIQAGQNPIKGVQNFLGHASSQVGQDIYNLLTQDTIDAAVFEPIPLDDGLLDGLVQQKLEEKEDEKLKFPRP